MPRYAEVIGDPIAHSLSPAIHRFWLEALGIDAGYRATRVPVDALAAHFEARRRDPDWRGCNVTAPLKQAVFPLLDDVGEEAGRIGAVNCIHRDGDRLIGLNTDVDGIAEALVGAKLRGRRAAIVGAGGAARAAIHHLVERRTDTVVLLARDPDKAAALDRLGGPATRIEVLPVEQAGEALDGAAAAINATPCGMAHAAPMPAAALAALGRAASDAVVLDMVYQPLDTPFLQAARQAGLTAMDGLVMLVGQARRAFELFYGAVPPAELDGQLRKILTGPAEKSKIRR